MKEADNGHWRPDALARWNRLPSEEGRPTVVLSAHNAESLRKYGPLRTVLRRKRGVWWIESIGFDSVFPEPVASLDAVLVDLRTKFLLPAFTNAHTHLDLTHIGSRPYDPTGPQGFASWVQMVIRERATDPEAIRTSVRLGIEKSLAGGVAAVGDIAGIMRTEPVEELRASPLAGVSFVEFFGTGERQAATIDAMRAMVGRVGLEEDGVRLGLQPHALYSAGPEVYRAADDLRAQRGVSLSTHVAESLEERRLLTTGDGPMRDFLATIGLDWNEPPALSPTAMFASSSRAEGWLLAHANDLSDDDIELLRSLGASVAYCARGHKYFGHEETIGAHRWRDLRAAGVQVCLGTDSIINLPVAHEDRISPLDDARELFRAHRTGENAHDAALGKELLDMITTVPAEALGMNVCASWMVPGPVLGIVSVEVGEVDERSPYVSVLESDASPELLALSDKRALDAAGLLWARKDA